MGLPIDPDIRGEGGPWTPPLVGDTYARIQACGRSFAQGILKFHDSVSGPKAVELINGLFAELGGAAEPFAFDWLGRQYCIVDGSLTESGSAEVAALDPFDVSVEFLVLRGEFLGFLASPDMLEYVEQPLFMEWLAANSETSLGFDQCAGAVHPGFLGGQRTVENLELSDVEVYWSVMDYAAQAAAPVAEGEKLEKL